MLLHASSFSYRLYGMDIDPLAVTICLCNGSFYAPWAYVFFPRLGSWNSSNQKRSNQTKQHNANEPGPL